MVYHDIVVVGNITKAVEKTLCDAFYSTFFVRNSSKAYIMGYQTKILIFRLKDKIIEEEALNQFNDFVESQICQIIFSETYSQQSDEVDAYFFFLSSNRDVTAEEKGSFVQKIEELIECKVQIHEEVNFINLYKSQISSVEITSKLLSLLLTRRFVDMLFQLNNPALKKKSYGVKL